MRYQLVLLLIVGFMISGCTQYQWQKRGATSRELNKDLYACQTEAAKTFPTYMVTGQENSGFANTATTNCDSYSSTRSSDHRTSSVDCTTTALPTTDANANNRETATNQCMYARGWKLVQKNLNNSSFRRQVGIPWRVYVIQKAAVWPPLFFSKYPESN